MYHVVHNTCIVHWKKHQDAVFWVDINLAIRKGLTFYQTRSNAIILQGTLPAYCIPKVVRLKTGEVLYEKSYMSPRPPPKISFRHDWTRGEVPLGSTVDQQPEGKVVRQSRGEVQHATISQLTQPIPKPICNVLSVVTNPVPIPKPICDRSGQPDERNSSKARTQSNNNMLLKYIVKLRYSTRTMSSIVKSSRRTSTSTFQDYHILP